MKSGIFLLVILSLLFFYFAAVLPRWGTADTEERIVRKWHPEPWQNSPVLKLNDSDRSVVLLKFIELDREEIKFWQGQLFTISSWVNAAILGIVSFVLQRRSPTALIRFTSAGICVTLSIFYVLFVSVTQGSMATNEHDLRGLEIGLGLFTNNWYLGGQSIYAPQTDQFGVIGHEFLYHLVLFNVVLTIVSAFLILVFLPRRQLKINAGPKSAA
jgi:hypothetical protein